MASRAIKTAFRVNKRKVKSLPRKPLSGLLSSIGNAPLVMFVHPCDKNRVHKFYEQEGLAPLLVDIIVSKLSTIGECVIAQRPNFSAWKSVQPSKLNENFQWFSFT